MRLVVHRINVKIWHRMRDMQTEWSEYRFTSSEASRVELPSWSEVHRSASEPIEVDAPALSRLVEVSLPTNGDKTPAVPPEGLRLVTPGAEKFGLDARSVYTLAQYGMRGFRLVAGEARKQTSPAQASVVEPEPAPELPTAPWEDEIAVIPPDGITPVRATAHLSNAVENMHGPMQDADELPPATRWGISFAAPELPHHRSFLAASSLTPTGRVASTRDLPHVASWPDPAQAEGWMRGAGLDPAVPIPIGVGYLYPTVAEIPAELPGYGVEFELSAITTARLAVNPAPDPGPTVRVDAPITSDPKPKGRRRAPAQVEQATFAFED